MAVADALQAEAADPQAEEETEEAVVAAVVAAAVVAAIAQQTRLVPRSLRKLSSRGQSPLAALSWQDNGRINCTQQLPHSVGEVKPVHGG